MKKTVVILSGGSSRRFGVDKALFRYQGVTMLSRLYSALEGEDEVILSVSDSRRAREYTRHIGTEIKCVIDKEIIGPLGGIVESAKEARNEVIVYCPVDMPFIYAEDIEHLVRELEHSDYACYLIDDMFSALLFASTRTHLLSINLRSNRAVEILRRSQKVSITHVKERGRLVNINYRDDIPEDLPSAPTFGDTRRLHVPVFSEDCEGLQREFEFWEEYRHIRRVIQKEIDKKCRSQSDE